MREGPPTSLFCMFLLQVPVGADRLRMWAAGFWLYTHPRCRFVMENILAVGVQTGPLTSDHIGFKNIYIHQLISFCLIIPSWVNGKTIS